ncbi:acylneuraminate cytidylyltransferase family protein [Hyphomonas sp.]|uniref:acylneuraminate cytidylyltransferase family protein n=1 Tax=Hyphomonas sp. TaxID=87 RepID=UPI001BCF9419|nr:acylneuraminate cytidylyltransferase family protein [Hyphomonas sp.]
MSATPECIALIPARAGSKRVAHKNIAPLAGHPLIAYTICAALDSGVFSRVVVSTDSEEYAAIARYYGAEVPFLRPAEISGDKSPDIEWILHALNHLRNPQEEVFECFALLRPTSPCRKPETIRRAWSQFIQQTGVDSLRAVELCAQHPGKMWIVRGDRMHPLMPMTHEDATPYHSSQYAALPKVYVQNASLEIAWSRVALEGGTISGEVLTPFLTYTDEGLDVNSQHDWRMLEAMVDGGEATLPTVNMPPYSKR